MDTNNNKNGKSNLNERFKGNCVHAPAFKRIVPMQQVKPAPNTPSTKPTKK